MNINTLCKATKGRMYIGTPDSGLYRSTNGGDTWNRYALDGKNVISLFIDSDDRIFVSTERLYVYESYRSTDEGASWIPLDPVFNGAVHQFTKSSDGNMYAGNDGDPWAQILYKSTNNGVNWTGIFNFQVKSIAVNSINYIYVSNGTELYFSPDIGQTWVQIEIATPENAISGLCIDPAGYLYVSTLGSSVFRSTETTIGIRTISNEVPDNFYLYQNFPNPFNSETKIEFYIKYASLTKITVYDILGNEIAVLLNDNVNPGKYIINWDANNTASGIYFYRMESSKFGMTKKMVLIK